MTAHTEITRLTTANVTSQRQPPTPSLTCSPSICPPDYDLPRHEGSVEGHPQIREIIRRVLGLLKETDCNATFRAACILVCPDNVWIPVPVVDARRLERGHRDAQPSRGLVLCTRTRFETRRYVVADELNHSWILYVPATSPSLPSSRPAPLSPLRLFPFQSFATILWDILFM